MDFAETRLRYTDENCTIKGALEIVGEKWSLLVLREAFFGIPALRRLPPHARLRAEPA